MLVGQIDEIKQAVDERFMKFKGDNNWYPEWRIVEFTFGGVWITNPKFDFHRVKADNARLFKKYFNKKK